jgi:hypothetical protein
MPPDKLIYMANRIGRAFAHESMAARSDTRRHISASLRAADARRGVFETEAVGKLGKMRSN